MAIARSKRLAVVLELAERAKEKAAKEFEQTRQLVAEEQLKLSQLADYYQDYQQSFTGQRAMHVQELVKQRAFLQQLSEAQKQQQGTVNRAEALLEQKRGAWQVAHLKHQTLGDLIKRYRADEELALDKKEQKMLDEWFQQSQGQR